MFSIINGSRTIINLGPQHPATHGVLRSIAILHGEIIQWISPEILYFNLILIKSFFLSLTL